MRRKYPFTPVLGWSISRYDKFELCKRQYWYDYYAQKWDREVPSQKLQFLKSLTTTHLEIGNLVHDTIAAQLHRLRKGAPPEDPTDIMNYAGYLADRALREKTFVEVYYGQREAVDAGDLKERVSGCLASFFKSRWYGWLREGADHQRDRWVIEPNDFGEVRINGLKAYCKVDFLFPTPQREWYILDWKTGKVDREKHRRQMMGYVIYAQDIFQAEAGRVNPIVVYLGETYAEMDNRFTQQELDDFAAQIAVQTREMQGYCADIAQNIPREKDGFPPQERKLCAYCNYQELCQG